MGGGVSQMLTRMRPLCTSVKGRLVWTRSFVLGVCRRELRPCFRVCLVPTFG